LGFLDRGGCGVINGNCRQPQDITFEPLEAAVLYAMRGWPVFKVLLGKIVRLHEEVVALHEAATTRPLLWSFHQIERGIDVVATHGFRRCEVAFIHRMLRMPRRPTTDEIERPIALGRRIDLIRQRLFR
jgi:hypothetical protein